MSRARLLDGRATAAVVRAETAAEVESLKREHGVVPRLEVILVGSDPASEIYVRSKARASREAGMESAINNLPGDTTQGALLRTIEGLNDDPRVHGILLQLPLPGHLDAKEAIAAIDPAKDVDGLHPENVGRLVAGVPGFVPCTPAGVVEILKRNGVPLAGREAVVIGRSDIVGKPLAILLLREHATVTICHSRTVDLPAVARRAEVLVAAIGRPAFITRDFIKPGAVVVDVGMNRCAREEDAARFWPGAAARLEEIRAKGSTLVGDVHPHDAMETASAFTPVPGGIGPMTIAMLLANTCRAARIAAAAPSGLSTARAQARSNTGLSVSARAGDDRDRDERLHRATEAADPDTPAGRARTSGESEIPRSNPLMTTRSEHPHSRPASRPASSPVSRLDSRSAFRSPEVGASLLTVGLTGGIACGKSTVDAMFETLGAVVIDADKIVHTLLDPGGDAVGAVLEAFGPRVAAGGGGVDRAALGSIVFADAVSRDRLGAIVHPFVTERIFEEIDACAKNRRGPIVIVDAALLVETGADRLFDRLIVVVCSEDKQLERLMAARSLTQPEAIARIRAQATAAEKAEKADYRIDNDGPLERTRLQVAGVYRSLLEDFKAKKDSWNQTRVH